VRAVDSVALVIGRMDRRSQRPRPSRSPSRPNTRGVTDELEVEQGWGRYGDGAGTIWDGGGLAGDKRGYRTAIAIAAPYHVAITMGPWDRALTPRAMTEPTDLALRPSTRQDVATALGSDDPVAAVDARLAEIAALEAGLQQEREKWQQARKLAARWPRLGRELEARVQPASY
jgi:hypothetical protein